VSASSIEVARKVADAVLFEGYLLYPYRANSAKNRARWQFGVLAPRPAAGDEQGGEPWFAQSECLVEPDDAVELTLTVRFLQVERRDGEVPWDEGVVREVTGTVSLAAGAEEQVIDFAQPGGEETRDGVTRRRWPLAGVVRVAVTGLEGPYGLLRVRVRVENHSAADHGPDAPREQMLRYAMVGTHTLLALTGGAFVSLLEPPEWARSAVETCENLHTWPVLVGTGRTDVMLSSPIILYDYPEIAPESPGDLYDATEIDEILTLRTMTLTDEEKSAARATDPRAAAIVDRIDAMPGEVLERLHGAVRYLRRVTDGPAAPPGPPTLTTPTEPARPAGPSGVDLAEGPPPLPDPSQPWWDPGADRSVSPETDAAPVTGGWAARGSRVRLRPATRGRDAQDMFLRERIATVQAVLFDVDGATHLAVTLDDDPAADLHQWYGRYLYFAPDEVELLEEEA
jgi:hypothetical protein